jgi:hypothetical protein
MRFVGFPVIGWTEQESRQLLLVSWWMRTLIRNGVRITYYKVQNSSADTLTVYTFRLTAIGYLHSHKQETTGISPILSPKQDDGTGRTFTRTATKNKRVPGRALEMSDPIDIP